MMGRAGLFRPSWLSRTGLLLGLVLSLLSGAERVSLLERFDHQDPRFAAGDALLNDCRLTTVDPTVAAQRVMRLEALLAAQPPHPDRALAWYFLGVNQQVCERFGAAADAFDQALELMPSLAQISAIEAYSSSCRKRHLAAVGPLWCGGLGGVFLLLGLVGCLSAPPGAVPWRRLVVAMGAALLIWLLLIPLVPLLMGAPAPSALTGYATPVLVTSLPGEIGQRSLWILALYGAVAISAGFVLAAAAARLPRGRVPTAVLAAGLVAACVVGVGYFRHFHGRYHFRDGRLLFLAQEIAWKKDVPAAMLPLFDEDFRARIMEAQAAAQESMHDSLPEGD